MDDLDNFLNTENEAPEAEVTTEAPEAEAIETPPAEQPEAAASQPRGPDGKFLPKGETQPEPEAPAEVAPPATEEPQFDHAATIGERRRRQEAEARAAELEQRLAQLEQRLPQQQPAQAPDMFEDPEGYTRYISAQAADQAQAQAYEQFQAQRIAASSREFAPTVPDYGEKVQVFQQMLNANPGLLNELHNAANPAEYAYNTAKTQLEIVAHGGLEGLIKARVQEAMKAQAPTPIAPTPPPVPDTLADAQSSRGAAPESASPPTFDQILGRTTA